MDLIHPEVSGNKWFKLKNNLLEAQRSGLRTILTFGGAFSNHIAATAAACKLLGFKSIGIIRGEESSVSNSTLAEAKQNGMQLHFVSRENYKRKEDQNFINELKKEFGDFYLIHEGGNNELGIMGCSEILTESMDQDLVLCASGTGATYVGLLKAIKPHQKLMVVNALKGGDDKEGLLNNYHFGGYAKHTSELLEFKSKFENDHNIPLDYVYTAKLFFAAFDLINKDKIPENSTVLIIHSGGLQGNAGYEKRYNLNPSR